MDNVPCHKAQVLSNWFVDDRFCIIDAQLTNLQQLCDAVISTSTKIFEEFLQHAVKAMPWRIKAVLSGYLHAFSLVH